MQRADAAQEPLADSELDLAVELYDAGIAYTDAMIARVLRRLEHLGIDRRTVVVLTSDHGELFGEHGVFNHVSLYEENLLVPLIIADPRRAHARRIPDQVRLVDLAPTILELAGEPAPIGIDGVSLVPLLDGGTAPEASGLAWSFAAASNYGIALRDHDRMKYTARLVPWPIAGPAERLFDLSADPSEDQGGLAGAPESARYRRLTSERLAQDLAGVRVRASSPAGGRRISGSLAAEQLYAQNVKSVDLDGAPLSYGPRKEAHFVVEPGASFDVVLLNVGGHLTLRLDPPRPGGRGLVTDVDLESLSAVLQVTTSGGGWVSSSGDRPAVQGVSLWWHRRGQRDAVEIDATVLDQLEALGYVP